MSSPLWRLRTWRRKLWELVGSDRHSRPGHPSILNGLKKHLESPGFFIEAGAVDGFFESNTYYLERFEGWTGILVEPVPAMFRRLRTNRPRSLHYNCALVASDYQQRTISICNAHAMSSITSHSTNGDTRSHSIDVPARTLASIIEEVKPPRIDLLSLDVEGYEIPALQGLDLNINRPRLILVECLTSEAKQSMDKFLADSYSCIDQLTYRDFLYAPRV